MYFGTCYFFPLLIFLLLFFCYFFPVTFFRYFFSCYFLSYNQNPLLWQFETQSDIPLLWHCYGNVRPSLRFFAMTMWDQPEISWDGDWRRFLNPCPPELRFQETTRNGLTQAAELREGFLLCMLTKGCVAGLFGHGLYARFLSGEGSHPHPPHIQSRRQISLAH